MKQNENFDEILYRCGAAAKLYDIEQIYLLVFARIESNFNPKAYNVGSGAKGVFQYLKSTAAEENIDPFNVAEATAATAKLIARDVTRLRAAKVEPSLTNLYLCHQQGDRGLGEILAASEDIAPLSLARIKNMVSNLPQKEGRMVADPNTTAKEKTTIFLTYWHQRMERAEKEVFAILAGE